MTQTRSMPQIPASVRDSETRDWMNNAAQRIDGVRVRVRATAEAQVSTDRDITLQAVDYTGQPVSGRYAVLVYLSVNADGAPGGTQTVTWNSGTVLATYTANVSYLVLTEADGTAELTVSGAAANRRVCAAVLGDVAIGTSIEWA